MALERERDKPVEQLGIGDAALGEELRVDARRGEAGNRVELVDDHLAVGAHEEVDPRHALAVRRDERLDRELLHALQRLGRQPGGHDQLHPAVRVLRVEVVPVGVGDDLADHRRDRVAVAEHADLDLHAGLELLHEDLVVVAAGERNRGLELLRSAHLRDPDRRPEPRRLDEDRDSRTGSRPGRRVAA